MRLLDEAFGKLSKGGTVPGEIVFKLYDTYGFPVDLTRLIAEERGFTVDEGGFEAEMAKQRARSEEFGGSGEQAVADVYKKLRETLGSTRFLGYDTCEAQGRITALLDEKGAALPEAAAGKAVQLVVDQTPFYGESGGQMGDAGLISSDGFQMAVTDTTKPGGDLIVHQGTVRSGRLRLGDTVTLVVDAARRDAIRRNHSATHLLHLALKEVLGDHVAQKGSLVAPDRLRFDFSHFQPMTEEERRKVEALVNAEVLANAESMTEVKSFEEARRAGAVALFGEKYGDVVRVMRIGRRSVELCGGTHVRRAGDIGLFKITQELGIAQGVRRIEAVTGEGALAYTQRLEEELGHTAERVRAPLFQVSAQVERLQKDLKERERRIEELQRKLASGGGRDLLAGAREVAGVRVVSSRADVGDPKALREVADQLRDRMKSGVVVLGGVDGGKVALVAAVSSDLVNRVHAGKIISELAKVVGGKGGGKPDLAQGGGTDPSRLDAALEAVYGLIEA
jgi:alanyl-tRNA synthetase